MSKEVEATEREAAIGRFLVAVAAHSLVYGPRSAMSFEASLIDDPLESHGFASGLFRLKPRGMWANEPIAYQATFGRLAQKIQFFGSEYIDHLTRVVLDQIVGGMESTASSHPATRSSKQSTISVNAILDCFGDLLSQPSGSRKAAA